jgi:TRAP-type C4-dicarboxylate transport system substrate-binding protein
VVTLANANEAPPDQLAVFADEVAKASDGTLRVEFKNNWRQHAEPQYERGVVADVQAGKVDLAWVGARVFDKVGVTSFQPLLAPMLIDNHDLQGKVFEAGIPEQMLGGLSSIGLVGVGVLPGPLRKLLSKGEPLTSPEAFRSKKIGIQDGAVAEQTFAALGATAMALPGGAKIADVDGYEQQLASIEGSHYEEQGAKNVVGNLNLWPRPLVVVAGKKVWDGLTDAQHTALTSAARRALAPALAASRAEDANPVAKICANGIAFPAASSSQLADLHSAVQPVLDKIAADPKLGGWLHRIEDLKSQYHRIDTASCSGRSPAPAPEGVLSNGVYRSVLVAADWKGCDFFTGPSGWRSLHEMVVEGNAIRLYEYPGDTRTGDPELGFSGTYRVFRGKFELLEDGIASPLVFDYTFDGKTLTLSNLRGALRQAADGCAHRVVWTTRPWVKATG